MAERMSSNPIVLLLLSGILIGLNFPLGKLAGDAAISPILWSLLISFSAAIVTLPGLVSSKRLTMPNLILARYAVISGTLSFVAANLLVFAAIPHVGAGYTGLMFALSPVLTLAISAMFRLRLPGWLGIVGIAVCLSGAALVAITRQTSDLDIPVVWIIAGFLIPLSLAIGNVYRTLAWPKDASPDLLAFWSHGASVLIFVAILLITKGGLGLETLLAVKGASLAQAIVAGLTFPVYFRLQLAGGPVMLSQLGYVAAAVGLIAATIFLGERYSQLTWLGAFIIALGIICVVVDYRKSHA